MDRSVYLRLFGDRTINSLGIFIDEGNPDRVKIIEEVNTGPAFGLPFATRESSTGGYSTSSTAHSP
jgi:hypothetical protein